MYLQKKYACPKKLYSDNEELLQELKDILTVKRTKGNQHYERKNYTL